MRWKGQFLQLAEHQPIRVKPKDRVSVEIRLDGTLHLKTKDSYLNYKTIPNAVYRAMLLAQPSRAKQKQRDSNFKGIGSTPANHPWRRFLNQRPYAGKRVALSLQSHFLE